MRFFASGLDRVPARQIAPTLVTALVLGFGLGWTLDVLQFVLQPVGTYWT
jgi:hypothetical protein